MTAKFDDARTLEDRKIAGMQAIGKAWDDNADFVCINVKTGAVQIETGDWRMTRDEPFPPLVGDA